ncbi:MAG: hypothetical protein ACE5JB_04305 [bacterium]
MTYAVRPRRVFCFELHKNIMVENFPEELDYFGDTFPLWPKNKSLYLKSHLISRQQITSALFQQLAYPFLGKIKGIKYGVHNATKSIETQADKIKKALSKYKKKKAENLFFLCGIALSYEYRRASLVKSKDMFERDKKFVKSFLNSESPSGAVDEIQEKIFLINGGKKWDYRKILMNIFGKDYTNRSSQLRNSVRQIVKLLLRPIKPPTLKDVSDGKISLEEYHKYYQEDVKRIIQQKCKIAENLLRFFLIELSEDQIKEYYYRPGLFRGEPIKCD